MDYESIIEMDCGFKQGSNCRIIRYESCWGPTGIKRVEYCERHCPFRHTEAPPDTPEDMLAFYGHQPKYHCHEQGER